MTTMWDRFPAQERERAALDYLKRHGFLRRARELADGDEHRLRQVVGFAVLLGLRVPGRRADELRRLVDVHTTTSRRHPWLQPGRRLLRALDLVRAVEQIDMEDFNFAAAMTFSTLRLVDTADSSSDVPGRFDAHAIVRSALESARDDEEPQCR